MATLEEVVRADLIVHVRDITHPDSNAQRADVADVLAGLGAGAESDKRVLEVHNKIDLLDAEAREALRTQIAGLKDKVAVSAQDGAGLASLRDSIDSNLKDGRRVTDFDLRAADGAALSWLYRHGEVLARTHEDDTVRLRVSLAPADAARFASRFPDA